MCMLHSIIKTLYLYLKLPTPVEEEKKMKIKNKALHLSFPLLPLLFLLSLRAHPATAAVENSRLIKSYIIHVDPSFDLDLNLWTVAQNLSPQRVVYSYKKVISGFAARLTEKELTMISAMKGFIGAHPDRLLGYQTTHTPEFLGLIPDGSNRGSWRGLGGGDGVVIGVIDSGVNPEHPSFSGAGMPPPPAKWKGRCYFNASQCNNKLIGARTLIGGASTAPPIDEVGHGSHAASIAAGAMVAGAELLGNAKGVAAGMAPRAHLAIYKVCGIEGCRSSDVLVGIEAAVEDGVDVVSVSLGAEAIPFFSDQMAVGAYRAVEKGIFVSYSAGNNGHAPKALMNGAPWVLTVSASSTDRDILASVKLGNGLTFSGQSIYQPGNFTHSQLPLVYAGSGPKPGAAFCGNGSLDGLDVKGKVVLCDQGSVSNEQDKFVGEAGGAAMIVAYAESIGYSSSAGVHNLPASEVSFFDGAKIKAYINSSRAPTASIIFKGTVFGASPAPAVAYFSSRGPNRMSPGILKPDITGPGCNILAAWTSPIGSPTTSKPFNMLSGTSMSTPHLAGIAAIIKSAHPSWSPAAIKSAIMTTADTNDRSGRKIVDESGLPASHFALGAGHVNPIKAIDPGLVYDLDLKDYNAYFCGKKYTVMEMLMITGRVVDCKKIAIITDAQLNYPSIMASLPGGVGSVTVSRTVKNVGEVGVEYLVKVEVEAVSVEADPGVLKFEQVGEEKRFSLTFRSEVRRRGMVEGRLKLVSSKQVVSSPLSINFEQ